MTAEERSFRTRSLAYRVDAGPWAGLRPCAGALQFFGPPDWWEWAPYDGATPVERARTVSREGGTFTIRFHYDEALVQAVKGVPGRAWDEEGRRWTVPARYERAVAGFARRHAFRVHYSAIEGEVTI